VTTAISAQDSVIVDRMSSDVAVTSVDPATGTLTVRTVCNYDFLYPLHRGLFVLAINIYCI